MKKKILIWVLIALGVVVFGLFYGMVWFMTGAPTIRENYVAQLNEMNRPVDVEEEKNALNHYIRSFELFVEPNEELNEIFRNIGYHEPRTADYSGQWNPYGP